MKDDQSKSNISIGRMFDESYKSEPNNVNIKNFDSQTKLHFEKILESNPKSVLDVGMGAGGLLLAIQNKDIDKVIGIELSHKGVELAKKRFELFGDITKASFFEGSFLDYKDENIELISMLRIIHCHPDYKGLIHKAIEFSPKFIVNTMPRRTWYTILTLNFMSIFTRLISGFRAYAHPTSEIDRILVESEYEKVFNQKSFFWVTSVFKRNQNKVNPDN